MASVHGGVITGPSLIETTSTQIIAPAFKHLPPFCMSDTTLKFDLEHKEFYIRVDVDGTLDLIVDNCLRKRDATAESVAYVWTNIELNWEEHRYVEARYRRDAQHLQVTVNRSTVFDQYLDANQPVDTNLR